MTWRFSAPAKSALLRLLSSLIRLEVEGLGMVPARGPLIVAANHARRQLDPVILALAMPRCVTFVSGWDLHRQPLVRLATLFGDVLYVTSEIHSLADFRCRCDQVLARGGVLVIFPEGAKMGDGAGVFRYGAAYLALRGRTPVLPARIDRCGRRRFAVRFGPLIPPRIGAVHRKSVVGLSEDIRKAIAALRPLEAEGRALSSSS